MSNGIKNTVNRTVAGCIDGNVEQLDPRIRFLDLNIRSLVGGITDKTKRFHSIFLIICLKIYLESSRVMYGSRVIPVSLITIVLPGNLCKH